MPWLLIWLGLVLATVLGAVLLGRHLYRSGKALVADLEKASELTDRLDRLQADLAQQYPTPVPPRPDLDADQAAIGRFRALRHQYRAGIGRRRAERLRRAARHWRSIGSPL